MGKPKIVFFTGSGISEESGIQTFRGNDGLWNEYKIEEVASISGWKKDPGKVLEFYNKRRKTMLEVIPNKAHKDIGTLYNNSKYTVSVITQNIDDLHEKGGVDNVIHLHGRLDQLRCSTDRTLVYPYDKDVKIGDTCKDGHQLRPNVVWFGETLSPVNFRKAGELIAESDYLIITGTSLQVSPAANLIYFVNTDCSIFYIDPSAEKIENGYSKNQSFKHIQEKATTGVSKVIDEIIDSLNEKTV